jgi:hypothetical protein
MRREKKKKRKKNGRKGRLPGRRAPTISEIEGNKRKKRENEEGDDDDDKASKKMGRITGRWVFKIQRKKSEASETARSKGLL